LSPHDHGHGHGDDHPVENTATMTRPFDPDAPVFDEPWQVQALALAERLKAAGLYSATDWAEALGVERARQAASGVPDSNAAYFEAVLATLERLSASTISPAARDRRRAEWEAAFARTPHGMPVVLAPDD
jgi:nitrile hydratase accessory protein